MIDETQYYVKYDGMANAYELYKLTPTALGDPILSRVGLDVKCKFPLGLLEVLDIYDLEGIGMFRLTGDALYKVQLAKANGSNINRKFIDTLIADTYE